MLSLYGIIKQACKYISPILIVKNIYIPVQNLLVELCTGLFLLIQYPYLRCKSCAHVGFLVFCFILNLHFSFLRLKRAHYVDGNISVDP